MNTNKIRLLIDKWTDVLAQLKDQGLPLPGEVDDLDEMASSIIAELDKAAPVRYARQGPPIQMQDVLLACGELNERERVAVQWVLDKVNELPRQVDRVPKVMTDEPVAWMSDDGEPISAKRHEDMEHAEHPLLVHYSTPLYLAPAAGLTVEEVDQCMDEVGDPPDNPDHFWQWREKVSARLTAAIEAKTRKP